MGTEFIALGKLNHPVGGGNATFWMSTAIKPQRRRRKLRYYLHISTVDTGVKLHVFVLVLVFKELLFALYRVVFPQRASVSNDFSLWLKRVKQRLLANPGYL